MSNQYGQNLGTIETTQNSNANTWQPSDYKTVYREGYNETINDQWLKVYSYVQKYGEMPRDLFQGMVYRAFADVEFFEDEQVIRRAVRSILGETVIGSIKRAPAAADKKKPGCRRMLGYQTDPKIKKDSNEDVVLSVDKDSGAREADIRSGDKIIKVDGKGQDDFFAVKSNVKKAYLKEQLEVIIEREGEKLTKNVKPKLSCPE